MNNFSNYQRVFESQHTGETVVLLLRQHIVTFLPKLLLGLSFFLIPTLFGLFPLETLFPNFSSGRYVLVIGWLWYLFSFAYLLEQFLFWHYNVYIITNERVVDMDFNGLLSTNVSEAPLDKIEDVTSQIIGFVPLFFRFGNVVIQTAAETRQFELANVPNPDRVVREIINLVSLPQKNHKEEK